MVSPGIRILAFLSTVLFCLPLMGQQLHEGDLLFACSDSANAIKPVVCLTPIDTFLCQNGAVIVGRVNVDLDVKRSVKSCLLMVGRPYDDLYLPGDSALYCSELVQRCFVNNDGKLVFNTIPMSFHDATGQVTDYWKAFYSRRGMAVPEGEPGTNPGELSRRPQVTVIGKLLRGNWQHDDKKLSTKN